MNQHVLVTGSAGRIGQAVVKALTVAGIPVVGFDLRPTPDLPAGQSIVGTLSDVDLLRKAATGSRCIVHLAATPDDVNFPPGLPPPYDVDNFLTDLVPNNVVGTYHVMDTASKTNVPRVILASTGQVIYGHLLTANDPVKPDVVPKPRYLYACTKVFAEALGYAYAQFQGVTVLVVRLGWCPRAGQEEELQKSDIGPDVYLSPGDAGRFFVSAVTASGLPPYAVVYATSRHVRRQRYDLTETTRLTGYVPLDSWTG